MTRATLALALMAALAFACGETSDPGSPSAAARGAPQGAAPAAPEPSAPAEPLPAAPAAQPADLAEEGRSVYMANCIACHAPDPTQDGPLGPPVAGSSAELLRARVLEGTYPKGYTPKRDTRAMIPLPHLAGKIDALAAYLAEVGSG